MRKYVTVNNKEEFVKIFKSTMGEDNMSESVNDFMFGDLPELPYYPIKVVLSVDYHRSNISPIDNSFNISKKVEVEIPEYQLRSSEKFKDMSADFYKVDNDFYIVDSLASLFSAIFAEVEGFREKHASYIQQYLDAKGITQDLFEGNKSIAAIINGNAAKDDMLNHLSVKLIDMNTSVEILKELTPTKELPTREAWLVTNLWPMQKPEPKETIEVTLPESGLKVNMGIPNIDEDIGIKIRGGSLGDLHSETYRRMINDDRMYDFDVVLDPNINNRSLEVLCYTGLPQKVFGTNYFYPELNKYRYTGRSGESLLIAEHKIVPFMKDSNIKSPVLVYRHVNVDEMNESDLHVLFMTTLLVEEEIKNGTTLAYHLIGEDLDVEEEIRVFNNIAKETYTPIKFIGVK